ncbi:hypothetical protein CSW18_06235 [Thermus scotoductus]|uniref:Uncharacterized protein n=1 Tax=Thermus scotoductus TaxID=37636 RepID=A0A430RXX4_THESC|nr:hypothetical protein CSW40_06260 [Thermus scotoductus]RTI39920.1 hypothetical protein CSW18_06235 [Thermus scotoductus]
MLLYRVLGLLDPLPQLVQGQVVGHGHGRRIQQERVSVCAVATRGVLVSWEGAWVFPHIYPSPLPYWRVNAYAGEYPKGGTLYVWFPRFQVPEKLHGDLLPGPPCVSRATFWPQPAWGGIRPTLGSWRGVVP